MSRIIQQNGTKGSLKWMQDIVNNNPALLNSCINKTAGSKKDMAIEWRSPLAVDEYAEYRIVIKRFLICWVLNSMMLN
jgi:hypothetical protein